MAGFALPKGFFCSGDRVIAGEQVEVLAPGSFDPGLGVVRRRRQHRQRVDDALDRVVLAVGQGDQRFERVVHLALGQDAIGPGGVVAGLGLQHIGLVRQAHIEAFVGLVELALEGVFFGFGRRQVVLGTQHGEVAFGALQNQVLLGGRQLQRGLLVDGVGGLQLEPAVGAKQRLAQGGPPGVGVTVGRGGRLVDLGTHVVAIGAGGQVRQQACASLGHHFFLRAVLGTGSGQVGVVVRRFLIDADQVGVGGQGRFSCPDQSVGRTRHGNSQ